MSHAQQLQWEADPISQYNNKIFFDSDSQTYCHCGIVLRLSGCLDFYLNYRLVEATPNHMRDKDNADNNNDEKISDQNKFTFVTSDFKNIYFRDDQNIYTIAMSWKQMMGLKVSLIVPIDTGLSRRQSLNKKWKMINNNQLSRSFNLYPSFTLFFTKMLLAHSNMVSIYDLLKEKWTSHFTFPERVEFLFRHKAVYAERKYEIGVLLENSNIYIM